MIERWAGRWSRGLVDLVLEPEAMQAIEFILDIFRNLSYASSSLRLLAYSPDVLAVLVGCLYQCSALSRIGGIGDEALASSASNKTKGTISVSAGSLAVLVLHTLVNMSFSFNAARKGPSP